MFSIFKREPGFYKKLIARALPMIIQNLITNSLGLVDTFMVGTLGEAPLAGVTLANIPIFVVQLMMFGFQSGSSVLISQYMGKGREILVEGRMESSKTEKDGQKRTWWGVTVETFDFCGSKQDAAPAPAPATAEPVPVDPPEELPF